jgi:hypothetical protein
MWPVAETLDGDGTDEGNHVIDGMRKKYCQEKGLA